MTDNPREVFNVVNESDEVIGEATRGEVHARGLRHRAVSIFVFNTAGQLLMQLRSATKDEYPSCWTSSCSGHVDAGEDYSTAAHRELMEELGLVLPLEQVGKFAAGPETANEFTVLYRATADEVPALHPEEIERVEFVDIEDVARQVEQSPEQYTPPFRVMLTWYMQNMA